MNGSASPKSHRSDNIVFIRSRKCTSGVIRRKYLRIRTAKLCYAGPAPTFVDMQCLWRLDRQPKTKYFAVDQQAQFQACTTLILVVAIGDGRSLEMRRWIDVRIIRENTVDICFRVLECVIVRAEENINGRTSRNTFCDIDTAANSNSVESTFGRQRPQLLEPALKWRRKRKSAGIRHTIR